MIILLEIDTETKESRVIEKEKLTEEVIIQIVTSYFGITIGDIQSKRKRDTIHTMCRQFLSYFLSTELGIIPKQIQTILGYSESSMIGTNFRIILTEINKPYNSELPNNYLRTYNNLNRLLTRYNHSLNV